MPLLKHCKDFILLAVMAMVALSSFGQLGWWNFDRRRRRDDFGILLPADPGALARRFTNADRSLRLVGGGADVSAMVAALQKERLELVTEARTLYDKATAEGRVLVEDERTRADAIEARLAVSKAELEALEADERRALELKAEQARMIAEASAATLALPKKAPVAAPAVIHKLGDPDPDEAGLPTPFTGFGKQLQAIARAAQGPHAIDPGLMEIQAALGMSEGVASDGGFLVQTDFTSELLELAHTTGILYGRTATVPISANANGIKINAVDETSRVDGSRTGGVRAYWTAEAADLTKSKPKFRQMELTLQKLTGLYYATDEELQDVAALEANVARWFGEEFGFKLDDALIRGTGAGMPLGVLGHAGTVSVAKETGQDAASIVLENVQKMYGRMWAPSVPRGEWFINQDCWQALFQLSQVVGVGGVPVFLPPGGVSAAPFGTLLGRPVTPIEQCETLGTVGDILFGDFSQYITIEKGGMQAASSIHVQFLTDETVFRFILRSDGQPKRNAPLTPFKGTATQSSFITLATRA